MISKGIGFPVLVLPGIQGRWEWMSPTIDALTAGHRVITCSLNELRPKIEKDGAFTAWTHLIDEVARQRAGAAGVDHRRVVRRPHCGAVCGAPARARDVAGAGLHAGAEVAPECRRHVLRRTSRTWRCRSSARADSRGCCRSSSPRGTRGRCACSSRGNTRRASCARPMHAGAERAWIREWLAYDQLSNDCRRITAPTLVVTGDSKLDRVVPVREHEEVPAPDSRRDTRRAARHGPRRRRVQAVPVRRAGRTVHPRGACRRANRARSRPRSGPTTARTRHAS